MYDWLPEALAGDASVVTANRRLARILQQEYGRQQLAAGKPAWTVPRIFYWTDWLDALLREAEGQESLPTRINRYHSGLLWERCLRKELGEEFIGAANLVRLARDTWQRLADWEVGIRDVARFARSADHKLFAAAAGRYASVLEAEEWVDEAGLGQAVQRLFMGRRIPVPGRLTFAGFDRDKPIVRRLREVLESAGCTVAESPQPPQASRPRLYGLEDGDAELRAAGAWARNRLEQDPNARIAIILEGLERDADRLAALVREGLLPGYRLSTKLPAGALNVSYGRNLASYPAVGIAMLWLRWLCGPLDADQVSHLLRSPLVGIGPIAGRARLERRIRSLPDRAWSTSMTTSALRGVEKADDAVDWLQRLGALSQARRALPTRTTPSQWAALFDETLRAAGWPGDGPVDSEDFQLINRWRDLLNDLARMGLVSGTLSAKGALRLLENMASEALYQPESDAARVHLLGPMEGSVLEFDGIWLAGMSANRWPSHGNPSVLVSRKLQQEFAMPDAIPSDTVDHARNLLGRLVAAAPAVICSYPLHEDDAEQGPSQLLLALGPKAEGAIRDPGWHAATLPGYLGVSTVSDRVPAIEGVERLSGGAATIQNHRTNPVAAFIGGRLGARALDEQARGLPALLRGVLVHDALYRLYFDKPDRLQLSEWRDTKARIANAVDQAFASHERHADVVLRELLLMERERVSRLLEGFKTLDTGRRDFAVLDVERKTTLIEAGVCLSLRIDRVDRLDDGRIAIIDYKTGAAKKFLDGKGEPREIQLLAYACASDEPIGALVLANIDSRNVGFDGAGAGFIEFEDWEDRLAGWSSLVRDACIGISRGDVGIYRHQSIEEARPLNLLTRFAELRND